MAEQVSSLIVRLIDQVTGPAKAVGRSLFGIGRAAKGASNVTLTDRLDAAQARLNRRMSNYRMQMVDNIAMVYAFSRALKRPIDAAREFESQLTEIGNKSGMTKEQLAAFGKSVAGLSKDTNQFTTDLLKGADILIGFGMEAGTAAKAIGTIGKTATATGASIEDLSRLGTASIMNLKVPVEQLEMAFDKLAQAGKMGGFELKDMAQYFPDLGAAFATFGQEGVGAVIDLGAALQIVRRSTGDAGQAANALANLLQKARAPLTVKKFEEYGIDIRKALEEGIAEGKSPIDIIVENTKTAQGKGALLEDLFSDKQVLEAVRPLLQFFEDYKKMREEAFKASGVVLKDFFAKMETNAERMKAFQITLDNLALSIGNALLPALTQLMNQITPVIEAFARWAERNPKLVASITGLVAGILAFNLAAVAFKYSAGFAYGGFLMLAKGVFTVSGAFTALSGAIAATGIGAIVIGIALAGIWIYNNWSGLAAMFDAFGRSLKAALGPEASAAISTVIEWVGKLVGWIGKLVGPMDYTEAQWRRIGFVAGQTIGNIVNRIGEIVAAIYSAAGEMYTAGVAFVQNLWDGMKAKFAELTGWIREQAASIASMFSWLGSNTMPATGRGSQAPAPAPKKRARGGPVSRGESYIVGERRPEIFTPNQNGYISQMGKQGGGTTISPTFHIAINGNADASTVESIRRVLRDEVRQAFRGVYADAGLRFA